ncbi:MAG: hypothetical protein AAF658_11920, partial [Myxococcota bacterium]
MHWLRNAAAALVVFTFSSPAARADADGSTLVVDLRSADESATWIGRAFEATIRRELSSFERFEVRDRRDVEMECARSDQGCRLDVYGDAGIDLVLFGRVTTTRFAFEVWDTGMGQEVARGEFELAETPTVARVRRRVLSTMAPLLQSGGWLDRRSFFLRPDESEVVLPPASLLRVLLSGVVATFGLPILGLWLWSRRREVSFGITRAGTLSLAVTAFGVLLLIATFIPTGAGTSLEDAVARTTELAGFDRLAALLGGLGWGGLLVLNLRLLVPKLYGIERADHRALGQLLRAWSLAVLLRGFRLVLLYAPFGLGLWAISSWLDVPGETTWTLLAPLLGLAVYVWLFTVTDVLTQVLDTQRIEGTPNRDHPWHRGVSKYFDGYLKRGGIDVPPSVRKRLLFLPTGGPSVVSYGGGFSDIRIAVPVTMLELALGQPPDDEDEVPRRFCDVDEWSAGTLLPGHAVATRPGEPPEEDAPLRPYRPPRFLGENSSVLGLVIPNRSEDATPLIANSREDFEVVQELLTDHYKRFVRREWDEEHDDTDPNQLDFLFASILYEVGAVRRDEILWHTWGLFLEELLAVSPKWLVSSARVLRTVLHPFSLERVPVVAEAYPALNLARHPMIQSLYYQLTGDIKPLTARADSLRLAST